MNLRLLRVTLLDRYLVSELTGPFLFGLSAFTLIFVATQILAISRLVSEEHAPLFAAIQYFLWDMPQYLLLVIPMAMLLGTLLALQRLSGESEVTAMKAGGVSLARIVLPLCGVGLLISLFALGVQELFVPLANDRAAYIREAVIKHLSPASSNLTVTTPLPGGGKQVTLAGGLDGATQSLIHVTVLQYDRESHVQAMIQSERARYDAPSWSFINATTYNFDHGELVRTAVSPLLSVDIGERPNEVVKRSTTYGDAEALSRAEIATALAGGTLSEPQRRTFKASYEAKLARPFASLVFVLIAVPFAMRPIRGGGTGLGFGLAVAIVFVYYVIATLCLSLGSLSEGIAGIAAWTPNAVFSAFGLVLLRRAAAV